MVARGRDDAPPVYVLHFVGGHGRRGEEEGSAGMGVWAVRAKHRDNDRFS